MRTVLAAWLLAATLSSQTPTAPAYDPLALPAAAPPPFALTVYDDARQREVPIRVFLPANEAPAPVVLFSHGLGGTRDTCNYLGAHWAARGYVVVFLQHPGSDDSVWRDAPLRERMATMEKAASLENLVLRCGDVVAVLDHLTTWNGLADHRLHHRLDLEHVGMSGHSFGAVTTQAVAGQTAPLVGRKFVDPRIDAAIVMSPSPPRAGDAGRAFAGVAVPWLLMTGTRDVAPIGGQTAESRRNVFPHLPAGIDRYELVLDGAEHGAFCERSLPGAKHAANPNHHRAILALSTAFWDAELRGDTAAHTWLHGSPAKAVLEAADVWQVRARGEATQASSAPTIR